MIKIKSIQFPQEHSVLGNLELNFCDNNGTPADTIIIAGENGTGKTTILEEIRKIMEYKSNCSGLELKFKCNKGIDHCIKYGDKKVQCGTNSYCVDEIEYDGKNVCQCTVDFQKETDLNSIYLPTTINFLPDTKVKSIEAVSLDEKKSNQILNDDNLITIKKLFVNIMINEDIKNRFEKAFNFLCKESNITYETVKPVNDNFEPLFKKNNEEFSIDDLSSGEKQIVFRGAFLLRDKEALNGAVILIDEPEISMHPKWQKKILDYYRELFIDNISKKQTSQIIVSTHSNFVIENALKLDNCVIIALPENNQVKKIIKRDGTFILPAVTAEEINYHVFNITSIGYHIQLFGYLHSLMEKHFSKDMNIKEVDNKIKNNQSLLSKNVLQDSKGNACQWVYGSKTYDTICCFIRNAIDHPEDLPTQTKKEYIDDLQYSIEILIELINLAKSSTSSLK